VAQTEIATDRLVHQATHDPLTGLPNRARLAEALPAALQRAEAHGTTTALLFVDFDDFKQVNDEYGHSVGDLVLRHVAARLRATLRADDLLVRQGGDEFLVLLSDLPPRNAEALARRVAGALLAVLDEPCSVTGGVEIAVRASIGVSLADSRASADRLLGSADAAMYAAKRDGGHRVTMLAAAAGPGRAV
jgi:diguanylate cyclase (GGDEF)-like protein